MQKQPVVLCCCVLIGAALLVGFASAAAVGVEHGAGAGAGSVARLRAAAIAGSSVSAGAGAAAGDDDEGGDDAGASGGDAGAGAGAGGPVRGPKKRPDWLQPVVPQTVAVPKEPSDEKAIRLIQAMKKPWEGMEDPRLSETEEGAAQHMAQHAKQNGEAKPTGAGADGNEADAPKPKAKRRSVVPLLPPVHPKRTLLWDPNDVLAPRWNEVADEWDKKAEEKMVNELPWHPFRSFSKRTNPLWAADVRAMHNQRYRKKHEDLKKYIPPNMRLNPPFFPHVVARYTDRVPSTDLNANPVEWPVQPRYIGEQPHGPYDQYHERPDRYLPPLELKTWRQQQRSRRTAIWPQPIRFPQMPAPGDTWNQMVELDTRIRPATHTDTDTDTDADAEDAAEEAEDEVDVDDAEEEGAEADEPEALLEAEAEAAADMTPQEMYWYWVQPERGRDRFGRDGRLFTPSNRRHPMHRFMNAADAATGHGRLHVPGAAGSHKSVYIGIPSNFERGIKPVKTQISAEPFGDSIAAALNVDDLQRALDVNKENGGRAAQAMMNDDRFPYLYSNGKPDESDYKKAPRPTAEGNEHDAEHAANLKKIKAAEAQSPWKMGAEGDLADHPNFPYPSYRRSYLGEVRGFAVPMRPPSLKYQRVKAGSKADYPVSYGGEQKEQPKAFLQIADQTESDDEDEDEAEAEAEEEEEGVDSDAAAEESDESEAEADEEDMALLQLSADESESLSADAPHARAHIPSSLHGPAPMIPRWSKLSRRGAPAPIHLDAEGNPIERDEQEEQPQQQQQHAELLEADAAAEHPSHPSHAVEAEGGAAEEDLPPSQKKPWWATKAGRARNAMSDEARAAHPARFYKGGVSVSARDDAKRVLDQPLFRSAYSAPVDSEHAGDEADTPKGSASALLDSLAALARNPLSDAANVFAGSPRSKADRSMAEEGRDQAMQFAGVDADAPRSTEGVDAPVFADGAAAAPAGGDMRFRQDLRSEAAGSAAAKQSPGTFAADPNSFDATLSAVGHADGLHGEEVVGADAGTPQGAAGTRAVADAESMRFAGAKAGPPPTPKNSESGYGVGLRGMILSQDAAIIAGPNRYRSPTLVNPWSTAMAKAQQPYGPGVGPIVPLGGAPYANFPYNYPAGFPGPNAVPAAPVYAPRGLGLSSAKKEVPTTVVNIYGGAGAVSTSAAPAPAAPAAAKPAAPVAAAYPYPYPAPAPFVDLHSVGAQRGPLPYGDTFPPSAGPYPPPLSGLMDIAASMRGALPPGSGGHPPPNLYGHPFHKVPVPQFPPSSPTVPYPRYPMGPAGALSESGWQKPRLIPIVYGGK